MSDHEPYRCPTGGRRDFSGLFCTVFLCVAYVTVDDGESVTVDRGVQAEKQTLREVRRGRVVVMVNKRVWRGLRAVTQLPHTESWTGSASDLSLQHMFLSPAMHREIVNEVSNRAAIFERYNDNSRRHVCTFVEAQDTSASALSHSAMLALPRTSSEVTRKQFLRHP